MWIIAMVAAVLLGPLALASTAQTPPRPADLLTRDDTSVDANGLALNPVWGWLKLGKKDEDIGDLCGFVAGPGLRSERPVRLRRMSCTSQHDLMVLNERKNDAVAGFACNQSTDEGELQGHVNWFVVSATGVVDFESYGRGRLEDHDFTLWLDTLADPRDSAAAAAPGRKGDIEIEFNGEEVFKWAGDSLTPWWKTLWRSAQRNNAAPDTLIGLMPALVTGVFGLDAIHGAHPELHPVYALALLTRELSEGAGATREHWAFFLRNGGNEGECANGLLPFRDLPTDSAGRFVFRFTIPWRAGARDVAARWPVGASGVIAGSAETEGPRLRYEAGRGVQLTFAIPQPVRPGKLTAVLGEVDLVWRSAAADRAEGRVNRGQHRHRGHRTPQPGEELEKKFGAGADTTAQIAVKAARDSNTFAPSPGGPVTPRHDFALTAAPLERARPREPAPVFVWRGGEPDASPPAQACHLWVPGCTVTARRGIGAGTVARGGGFTMTAILHETNTLPVKLPVVGAVRLLSVRASVGFDRMVTPLAQAAPSTLYHLSVALILRLKSTAYVGWYALVGPEADLGRARERALGMVVGAGVRRRTGRLVVPFVEVREALRVGRPGYLAWELGLLATMF